MHRESENAAERTASSGPAPWGGGFLIWALVGAAFVGCFSRLGPVRAGLAWIRRGPERVEVWAADRAAHAVFGFDYDGIVVQRRFAAGGRGIPVTATPPPRSWRIEEWLGLLGELRIAHAVDDPRWGRARPGGWALVRSEVGLETGTSFLERWVQTGSPPRWQRAFRFRLPWTSRAIASQEAGVWVAAERKCVLRHFAHHGALRFDCDLLDADGVDALCGASLRAGEGVWIAAGGALLRVDASGARRPGQGGFAHLTELASGSY